MSIFRLLPAPINTELGTKSFKNYKLFYDFKVLQKQITSTATKGIYLLPSQYINTIPFEDPLR